MSNFKNFLLSSTHENGFLLFTLGIVFILTIYNFILFFQNKNKAYIYYATYTLLIFLAYFTETKNDFLDNLTSPIKPFFELTHQFWVWLYNIVYFFFVFRFLNFKKHFPKHTKVISYLLFSLIFVALFSVVYGLFQKNTDLLDSAYLFIYIPIIVTLTLYSFGLLIKVKEKAKYYILIGSLVLFISSILIILIHDVKIIDNPEIGFLIFYSGVIIENMFFSLGLGQRHKLIIQEKNTANSKLVLKLQENEHLKEKVNLQLQEKIDALNQQITLKKQIEDLKLETLRSQMNPHFIFNALNSIKQYIVDNDPKLAAHYLTKFSKLIRKILEATATKEITLEEELETINLYVTIENIRFSNQIDFTIENNADSNTCAIKVPPLILQPFLENSIWHGLSSKKGNKKIRLIINQPNNRFLEILIIDNGVGRKASQKINKSKSIQRKSVGINLTKERLENFTTSFKNKYSIEYEDVEEENEFGTKVILRIPLI
ncbi:7TM protein involved in diverse intracellular signaling [Lutibacter sp. Hel_I_33_5]|uniref:sensor histidine kinase n=1 Tax=Lutibacter sp. Hel_I_33_5 TaxID=1566289 RepID=UPI00119F218A|nr:histidine kinase [Lutibacter sp. Hel_I_33_5]TVZ56295.1 7TM protein involved in diverse intracellular signaling [Lutibacter sp. Hel_I_33_5]